MKTCRRMLHQTKKRQMTSQKDSKMIHQQPGSIDARGIRDRTRKIQFARCLESDATAVHAEGRKESMHRVNVTIFASSGNSWHLDEIQSKTQGDEVRSCGITSRIHIVMRSCLWWSGQMPHGPTGKTCPQLLVSSQESRQRESCKVEDMVWRRFIIVLENRSEKQDRL